MKKGRWQMAEVRWQKAQEGGGSGKERGHSFLPVRWALLRTGSSARRGEIKTSGGPAKF
jgi:hypothetical protein